jgi:hypothetical protein
MSIVKQILLFLGAICVATTWNGHVRAESVPYDLGVLLVAEHGRLFVIKPPGGELQEIPHRQSIFSARGLAGSRTVMTATRNEEDKLVFRELSFEGEVLAQYPHPGGAHAASLSPDGQQYVYYDLLYKKLIVHDIKKNVSRVLAQLQDREGVQHINWSPDQETLAVALSGEKDAHLCLLRVNDAFERDKCFGTWLTLPSFSPDGRLLGYWERTKEPPNPIWSIAIREIAANGELGSPQYIFSREFDRNAYAWVTGPIAWSPDQQWLAFSLRVKLGSPFFQVFRMKVDGSVLQPIPIERSWWTIFRRTYLSHPETGWAGPDMQWLPDPFFSVDRN